MSAAPMAVIDASVSLKWALDDEEAVDGALALRDAALSGRFSMVAPSLWYYELTNGLVTAVRRGRLDPHDGAQALQLVLRLGVQLVDPTADAVHRTALTHGIAAYDAAYLALAGELAAPLWTGDRHLFERVTPREGRVRWIGDFLA